METSRNKQKAKRDGTKPKFCLNEFARLLVLIRDDSRSHHALCKAYKAKLSGKNNDARGNRHAFWSMVASRFNDHQVDSKQDFTGYLEEIDSNSRPLVERAPSLLKAHFYKGRRAFNGLQRVWSACRKKDPTRVIASLDLSSNTGDYTADSKRGLIIFLVCRMGTVHEDIELFRMVSKLASKEEGEFDEEINGTTAIGAGETKVRKRRSTEAQRNWGDAPKPRSIFTGYVKEQLQPQMAQSETSVNGGRQYSIEADEEGALLDKLLVSVDICKRAQELGDDELNQIVEMNLIQNKKRFKKFCKNKWASDQGGFLIDQLLASVDRCKRARELGDDEVNQMAEMNLIRNKKRIKTFCENKRAGDQG